MRRAFALALLAALALSGAAFAVDYFAVSGTAKDASGNALVSPAIKVYVASNGNTATIYSDNAGSSQANPFTAGSDGTYSFWVIAGTYRVVATKSGVDYTTIIKRPAGKIPITDLYGMCSPASGTYSLAWDTSGVVSCVESGSGGGGGGGNSFTTMNAPSGTDPVADSTSDTLNLVATSPVTITGNSTTDTITMSLAGLTSESAGAGIRWKLDNGINATSNGLGGFRFVDQADDGLVMESNGGGIYLKEPVNGVLINAYNTASPGGAGSDVTIEGDYLEFLTSSGQASTAPHDRHIWLVSNTGPIVASATGTGGSISLNGPSSRSVVVNGSGTTVTGPLIGALTGNADTATALAANGGNCSANTYPLGVDASGAAESCGTIASAGITDGTIVNADINASAAIALSKLATATASKCARFDSGGVLVPASGDCASGDTGVSGLGSTDNAILRADGTGGSTAQGSLVTIDDTGHLFAVQGSDASPGIQCSGGNCRIGTTDASNLRFVVNQTARWHINASVNEGDFVDAGGNGGSANLIYNASTNHPAFTFTGSRTSGLGTVGTDLLAMFVSDAAVVKYNANGLRLVDTGSRPTCDSTIRGQLFYDAGGAGVADTVAVCAKDSGDSYAWRTIY